MKRKYIIGIDGGSQSSKVVIYDLEGNVVCEGKQDLRPMHLPKPGIVEHPGDDLWDSIVIACKRAMTCFQGEPKDIIGIGLCTIRFCRALLKADGTLASPVMSWMDTRVSKPYEDNNPAVKYVTTSSGYITHRFTGEFKDTAANYQGVWPMDTDTWQWTKDETVVKQVGMPREMLFELQMPGTILGHITESAAKETGIPKGIPVVATANDKAVEALGAGSLSEKTALISLGTYIASMVHGYENLKDSNHFWTNFASIPNQYLYESYGIRRGMWTVSWFKDLLGDEIALKAKVLGIQPEELLNREAQLIPAGSDGLMTVLDWLAPTDAPFKKGIMIGFDGRHTRAHIYRSILEAIALTMKNRADAMCNELKIELDRIIISGGGANSELFMQIFADVFGLSASRNVISGSASLGSAICVAVAMGVYDSYANAIDKMVKVRDTFDPNPENTVLYKRLNDAAYKKITEYTDEILKKSYPIFL
ncbi:FGGY-family carbohydrate kinase [Geosporobacter ferrireducens]|uniref:Sugar kinase n=1 Tax=Geosporobacter ferrireducens TaxID=1424294 RepID=A0A1D8GDB2_9FIRM|nr:FGGY family carbohydrate kinase [Geosporobacter ferrireducens]AOT68900.1 sugar kinase [Geosporobacter ferrireducens]MTI54865.1 sugar kinase [Geosporobacter ferrireducens]